MAIPFAANCRSVSNMAPSMGKKTFGRGHQLALESVPMYIDQSGSKNTSLPVDFIATDRTADFRDHTIAHGNACLCYLVGQIDLGSGD